MAEYRMTYLDAKNLLMIVPINLARLNLLNHIHRKYLRL